MPLSQSRNAEDKARPIKCGTVKAVRTHRPVHHAANRRKSTRRNELTLASNTGSVPWSSGIYGITQWFNRSRRKTQIQIESDKRICWYMSEIPPYKETSVYCVPNSAPSRAIEIFQSPPNGFGGDSRIMQQWGRSLESLTKTRTKTNKCYTPQCRT